MIVKIKDAVDGEVLLCLVAGMFALLVEYAAGALKASGVLAEVIGNGLAGHIADACFGAFLMAMRQRIGIAAAPSTEPKA